MKELTLQSGTTVPLAIGFGPLYKLREQRPEEYKRYQHATNAMESKGKDQEEDKMFLIADLAYTAYLCGQIRVGRSLEEAMDYEDYLDELPDDMTYIANTVTELIRPKKEGASEIRSNAQRKDFGSPRNHRNFK